MGNETGNSLKCVYELNAELDVFILQGQEMGGYLREFLIMGSWMLIVLYR